MSNLMELELPLLTCIIIALMQVRRGDLKTVPRWGVLFASLTDVLWPRARASVVRGMGLEFAALPRCPCPAAYCPQQKIASGRRGPQYNSQYNSQYSTQIAQKR
jgi:hypothetical protein